MYEFIFIILVVLIIFIAYIWLIILLKKFHAYKLAKSQLDKLVIVTSHYKEDLNWLKESPWKVIVCSKIGSPSKPEINLDEKCLCENKGNECTSYLKYIIANYYQLPEYIAFIHGHETAWHQNLVLKGKYKSNILNLIENAKIIDHDFISLNGTFIDDRKKGKLLGFDYLRFLWPIHFQPFLGLELPDYVFHDCCAQFIVHKSMITRLPLAVWEHWFKLFYNPDINHKILGYSFEYCWHILFGQDPVLKFSSKQDYLQNFFETQ